MGLEDFLFLCVILCTVLMVVAIYPNQRCRLFSTLVLGADNRESNVIANEPCNSSNENFEEMFANGGKDEQIFKQSQMEHERLVEEQARLFSTLKASVDKLTEIDFNQALYNAYQMQRTLKRKPIEKHVTEMLSSKRVT